MMGKLLFFLNIVFVLSASAIAQDDEEIWYEHYELIDYSELRTLIDQEKIEAARILDDGWWVTIKTIDGKFFDTRITPHIPIADHFYAAGIPVGIMHKKQDSGTSESAQLPEIFFNILPLLIFIVVFLFVVRLSQQHGKKAQDECLDRAKIINDELLAQQEKQFDDFINKLSLVLGNKSNG